jgi:hypothetical protein
MRIMLLAEVMWYSLCFLMAVIAWWFVRLMMRGLRPRSGGPFPASTGAYGNRLTAKSETPPEGNVLFLARKEVRRMSGLQSLTEKYVAELKELETRMKDVKRKLETVMEASRLLEEEGLSEDSPPSRFGEDRTYTEKR